MNEYHRAGTWDFSGQCAPGGEWPATYKTFSLGIFQWEPRSGGKGTKKGKVQLRVVGQTNDPEAATARAREVCGSLNAGVPLSKFKKRIVV